MTPSPHRRYNPLRGEWVLVSPHRMARPWQGEEMPSAATAPPAYDRECYLCPGNRRAKNKRNPSYRDIHIFTNDFSALLEETDQEDTRATELLQCRQARGTCRVICYSPLHNVSFASMATKEMEKVIEAWRHELERLGEQYKYVQIFENKGAMVGCSNDHPHGQIWACDFLPTEARKEQVQQDDWMRTHKNPLLRDYLNQEQARRERIVLQNEHWVLLTPYWGYWPYETLLLPCQDISSLRQLDEKQRRSLAEMLKELIIKYDALFGISFPYLMGWHGEVHPRPDTKHRLLHCHFYPPLLRSAQVRKYSASFELCAELQRDMTPEEAAEKLRDA